jgi:hypothetical protein
MIVTTDHRIPSALDGYEVLLRNKRLENSPIWLGQQNRTVRSRCNLRRHGHL